MTTLFGGGVERVVSDAPPPVAENCRPAKGPMLTFATSSSTVSGRLVVSVVGDIDVATSPVLRGVLYEHAGGDAASMIVDLTGVDFIDSTGLSVLVGTFKRLRQRGATMALVCRHERVLRIFRLTALDRIFALYGSLAAAVHAPAPAAAVENDATEHA
jgi:anti-sigma B factor antagonist